MDKINLQLFAEAGEGLRFAVYSTYAAVTGVEDPDISEAIIPETYEGLPVTHIGEEAFAWCYNLASVTIPNSVTSIDAGAFRCCESLMSINIPDGVTEIRYGMFYECYNLTSVTIPESVTSIEHEAFNSCCSLTSVTIPGSVTYIGNYAFFDCGCVSVYDFSRCLSVPCSASISAFEGISDDCLIVVPPSLCEEWKSATNWSEYASHITSNVKKVDLTMLGLEPGTYTIRAVSKAEGYTKSAKSNAVTYVAK